MHLEEARMTSDTNRVIYWSHETSMILSDLQENEKLINRDII